MDVTGEDLSGSTLRRVDLSRSEWQRVDLTDARLDNVLFNRTVIRGAEMADLDITGDLGRVVINGVDVAPLITAELDRRHPGRDKMRPADADGFREAWAVLEDLWAGTVARARQLPEERLHDSVDGEWSFIETLRHLNFATDSWVRRVIQGDPRPWHPLDLPWDEADESLDIPRDRTARPSLDEILELRKDRVAGVRALLETLTDEQLNGRTEPVDGPGWPPADAYDIREVLLILLNEEWEHRLYAERDLARL